MATPEEPPTCPVHDKPLTRTGVKTDAGRSITVYSCPDAHTVQKVMTSPPQRN